jgi:large subunit ribosomal protein L15
MKLHNLERPAGSRKNRKRVGRGTASGTGGTSGKGHKGQKARSGGSISPMFEGGQMPLSRRLPKFGFTNIFKKEYTVVSLGDLEKLGVSGEITPDLLVERGVIKRSEKGMVKVLGGGSISKAVTVTAAGFSKSAVEKIEKAGGKTLVVLP